jgi:hypothetical protein
MKTGEDIGNYGYPLLTGRNLELVFNIVRTNYSACLGCPVNSPVDPFSLMSIHHLQNDRIFS